MHKTSVLIATSAALIGGAGLAVSAHGQTARTLTFTAPLPGRHDARQVDVSPRGMSLGDGSVAAQTIRLNGQPVGRMLTDCVALDYRYRGRACTLTLVTRQGQIIAQGGGEERPVPGHSGDAGTSDTFAVTGGTGEYAGATGTISARQSRRGETIAVTLGS
jgi:hypothetical protein